MAALVMMWPLDSHWPTTTSADETEYVCVCEGGKRFSVITCLNVQEMNTIQMYKVKEKQAIL